MQLEEFLKTSFTRGASDIFVTAGLPIKMRVQGRLIEIGDKRLMPEDTKDILQGLYSIANRRFSLLENGDDDFSLSLPGVGRYRVNAFRQRAAHAAVIRTIPFDIPDPDQLGIPEVIVNLANNKRGIVLFTGTTGSGKSTSLACLIDKINKERDDHIVTIEDPIEYRHQHKKSVISQRELTDDTMTYLTALRAAMRQAPDVILVGEMRDYETISSAVTAAETGHLVFSTLHTIGGAATINRIIDVFPEAGQNQIRAQLATTLQAVVSQQLVPTVDGKRVAAFEIMIVNAAIRNLIRENKIFQIESIIQTSSAAGMKTMDMSLHELYRQRRITLDEAMAFAVDQKDLTRRMKGG